MRSCTDESPAAPRLLAIASISSKKMTAGAAARARAKRRASARSDAPSHFERSSTRWGGEGEGGARWEGEGEGGARWGGGGRRGDCEDCGSSSRDWWNPSSCCVVREVAGASGRCD